MQATTYLGKSILPRGRKCRALLGYLCLASGARAPRTRLASLLWDRVPEAQARTSLRQALHEMCEFMGTLASELLTIDRQTVTLNLKACWVDAVAVLDSEAGTGELLRSDLLAICSGELLEDLEGVSTSFDQWLLTERTRFTEKLRKLFEKELEERSSGEASAEQRASIARQLIHFDPTHEGASRHLMRALSELGERAQALREYERCREALRIGLDIEPSRETHALYEAIRTMPIRGDAGSRRPKLVPLEPPHHVRPDADAEQHRARLRVGVLPFKATGSNPDEALAFSLSQEIAAALARFRWFDVIAPVSFGRNAPAATEDAALKEMDYSVDGSLVTFGERLQVSVRLLDVAQFTRPVWSDRFELDLNELGRLDELVTSPIVARIDPVILFIEGHHKRQEPSGATGLLLRAIPLIYRLERDKYEEAGRLINQALEIDPDNAMACAWAAFWQVFYVGQGWTRDTQKSLAIAQDLSIKAIKLDPDNAEALAICGHISSFLHKDFDSALHYFERALRLNPSLGFAWAMSAATYSYIGQPDESLRRLARYQELQPSDPYFFWIESLYVIAYFFKADYEQAASIGRRVVKSNPEYSNGYKPLIAALGHLGRVDEAKPYVTKLLSLEPNFTVQLHGQVYPFLKEADRERYLEGLRLAGVPEE